MAVTKEAKITSYDDIMGANADLMAEVYNDAKLTASEKLRNFSLGVRNQVLLSRDMAARRKELFSYGMKVSGDMNQLTFTPSDQTA